ncbi:MAG: hypothetical protein ACTSRS_07265 [Candidatus Helarchaeota archaeon]
MIKQKHLKKGGFQNFTIIHKKVLEIAQQLRGQFRTFKMHELFETCLKGLPYPEPEIYKVIHELYQQKFLIEGKRLFKGDILQNEKRRRIYEYIEKNPGAHTREIRRVFNLGAYMAYRHLNILVRFGFLRKKHWRNKIVYFKSDFDPRYETNVLLLRNDITKRIYDYLRSYGALKMSELAKLLQIPYTTIQGHLIRLVDGALISKIKVGMDTLYTISVVEGEKREGEEGTAKI